MYYNPTTGEITYGLIVANIANTVTDNAQPNITSVGTLTNLFVSGNVTASRFISNITTGTAPFTVSSTTQVANLSVATADSANTAGTVTTNAQPNITSVGTLTSLNVTGNANVGNIGATSGIFTNVQGTLTTGPQPNITSTGTLTSLAVTGNISAGNVSATTFTGSLSGAATSATTAGTVTTNAQPNITSVGTLTSLAVTGNITSGNVYANSGTIDASLLGGTLTTAPQPNVTSVGSQTNLRLSGNVSMIQLNTGGSSVSLGNTQFWDTSGTNLTGNFYIQLGALPNIGDVRQTSVLVTNGGANTFTWLQPGGGGAGLVAAAGTVNYFFNPTYPYTGTAKDLYKFTLARIANVGLNTAYDVIVEKTALT
jgi:hypothetical protein